MYSEYVVVDDIEYYVETDDGVIYSIYLDGSELYDLEDGLEDNLFKQIEKEVLKNHERLIKRVGDYDYEG